MSIAPLKFRILPNGKLIFSDDTGTYFESDEKFLKRYGETGLSEKDISFLKLNGHVVDDTSPLSRTAYAYRWSQRQATPAELDYVIIVPTLRCNLTCSYCQVSRADIRAAGFDMSEETVRATLAHLDRLSAKQIKFEFQGGEPLLRLDLLKTIRTFCRKRFPGSTFVVCTNLQQLVEPHWLFLDADDTFVSTSLDGPSAVHQRQRTKTTELTKEFHQNLRCALDRLGAKKVSALPTIDVSSPPNAPDLVSTYVSFGLTSIYLRPVNYQGFARRYQHTDGRLPEWNAYYRSFVEYLIQYNKQNNSAVEEFYFSNILKRVLRAGEDGHVDIRNPNTMYSSYMLIDYDGQLYPTDEARMLHRIGQIDLSIGSVFSGVDLGKVSYLNANSSNNFDPDCIHCPYQPYCGTDIVDDLSRYGRIDLPRSLTWFCNRHLYVFDLAFEMLYSKNEAVRASIAKWLSIDTVSNELIPSWP